MCMDLKSPHLVYYNISASIPSCWCQHRRQSKMKGGIAPWSARVMLATRWNTRKTLALLRSFFHFFFSCRHTSTGAKHGSLNERTRLSAQLRGEQCATSSVIRLRERSFFVAIPPHQSGTEFMKTTKSGLMWLVLS